MKFFFGGESGIAYLERLTYDGVIGVFWDNTLSGLLAYLLAVLLFLFAIIGVISTLKFLFTKLFMKKKKSKYL